MTEPRDSLPDLRLIWEDGFRAGVKAARRALDRAIEACP